MNSHTVYCLHSFCVSGSAYASPSPKEKTRSQVSGKPAARGAFRRSRQYRPCSWRQPGGSLEADSGKLCLSRRLPCGPSPAPAGGFGLATGALGQEVQFRGMKIALCTSSPPSATVPAHLFSAQPVILSDGLFPYSKAYEPQRAQLPGCYPRGTMMTVRSRIQGPSTGKWQGMLASV